MNIDGIELGHGSWRTAALGALVFLLTQASSPVSSLAAAPSNVCVTASVTCAVTPGTTRGAPCQCLVPPATWVPGVAEYWVSVPSEIP
jgi:hypothetical protein